MFQIQFSRAHLTQDGFQKHVPRFGFPQPTPPSPPFSLCNVFPRSLRVVSISKYVYTRSEGGKRKKRYIGFSLSSLYHTHIRSLLSPSLECYWMDTARTRHITCMYVNKHNIFTWRFLSQYKRAAIRHICICLAAFRSTASS